MRTPRGRAHRGPDPGGTRGRDPREEGESTLSRPSLEENSRRSEEEDPSAVDADARRSSYRLRRYPSQIPAIPPTMLSTIDESENALACHNVGAQPPTVEPTIAPSQMSFRSIAREGSAWTVISRDGRSRARSAARPTCLRRTPLPPPRARGDATDRRTSSPAPFRPSTGSPSRP